MAIIDWGNDPMIASDLGVFDSHYRLATCTIANGCLNVLDQNGATSPLPPDEGGAGEISLDVETVHAVCQKCRIDLIEVDDSSNPSVETGVNEAVKLGATEVSNSYGGPGPAGGSSAADKASYNHRGVVITASTGDDGYDSYDWWIKTPSGEPAANPSAPDFPAELATVVSVGGTSLFSNQDGTRQYETVWNDNGPQAEYEQALGQPLGASGGGCSLFVAAPSWQRQLSSWPKTGCGTKQLAADVSAVADPFTGFDTYNASDGGTGWATVGATSLASPLIAAMFALAGGSHGIAYPTVAAQRVVTLLVRRDEEDPAAHQEAPSSIRFRFSSALAAAPPITSAMADGSASTE